MEGIKEPIKQTSIRMNISLTKEDFEKLISGEIIQKGEHKIALQDIGYHEMFRMVGELYSKWLKKGYKNNAALQDD